MWHRGGTRMNASHWTRTEYDDYHNCRRTVPTSIENSTYEFQLIRWIFHFCWLMWVCIWLNLPFRIPNKSPFRMLHHFIRPKSLISINATIRNSVNWQRNFTFFQASHWIFGRFFPFSFAFGNDCQMPLSSHNFNT